MLYISLVLMYNYYEYILKRINQMYLKSIEIQGFKSFPDKTVLKFDRGMTAVVGPNGSGKSNISDAVKWVLGEQSTKNLRSSKMEDVIFSGTGARKALGFAEVTLRLDNTDKYFNTDGDEVSVTRRYFRSGNSEYLIDGKEARLRDVNELFMDTGLGRDGYSMVGQGKIEDLVSSKSADRRDIFEEAAGISHYRYRRTEALKRLNAAEENLVRLRDILNELEGRVEPLRIQSEKAKKFVVLAEEKKNLEIGLWLDILGKSAGQIREQANKLEIAEVQHTQAANALDIISSEIENARQQSAEITLQIEDIQRDSAKREEEASALDSSIAVDRNSIEHNSAAIERARSDRLTEEATDRHFSERLGTARKEITELNAAITDMREQLSSKMTELNDANSEDEIISDKIAAAEDRIAALTEELAKHSAMKSSAESAIGEITSRISGIDGESDERNTQITELTEKKIRTETAVEKLNDETASLVNALSGYRLKTDNKAAKLEEQKKLADAKYIETERTRSRIRMLEEMERSMDGYSGAVKAVTHEQQNGGLKGIHGTLSHLISTGGEYAVAIETALGGAIQNIVTDTENDAKKAMYFLRDRNAGRATFLPLSAIRGKTLDERGLEDNTGFVDIASNLLEYDSKYEQIILSLLGRTVIVEDTDCAVAIAKKYSHRFKIVTLDGQVINAGGSMTGGSQIKNAGFLSRASEIDEQKKKLAEAEKELAAIRNKQKLLTEELAKAKADSDGTEAELFRIKEEKIRTESALTVITGQLDALIGARKDIDAEKKSSAIRVAELREKADAASEKIDALRADIDAAESGKQAVREQRRKIQSSRDEINAAIAKLNMDIISSLKDIESRETDIRSLENRRASHTDRTTALGEEIETLTNANNELLARISGTQRAADGIRAEIRLNNERIAGLVEKRNGYEHTSVELRAAEKEKNAEKEKLAAEIVRLQERKSALEKEQQEIEKKLYEEYQLTKNEAAALGIVLENIAESERRLRELRAKIRALGSVNVSAIDEYKEVSERYEFLKTQIDDVEKSKAELTRMIEDLTTKMSAQFREKFAQINTYFTETFRELFGGGDAGLILEDPSDVLECGIEIKAQPPGKNVKSLSLLSGGEKGLTAISLLFAILKLNPAPFCFFDEVEAALDDVNVSKYAKYIRTFTDKTQFILITHRRGSMEEADTMYGVTMQEEGVSKLLKLETSEIAKDWGLE